MSKYKNIVFLKLDNIVQSFDVIAKIIKNNKIEDKKISIISNNISKYDKIIDEIFDNYKILLNKSYSISIFDSSIYRLIICINNLINFGVDKDEILNFLDFLSDDFSDEEICHFKNYCYVYDIDKFENEFTMSPIRNIRENDEKNIKILKSVNNIREKIFDLILKFKNESKKYGICKCILDFLNKKNFNKIKYFDIFVAILKKIQDEVKNKEFIYELNKNIIVSYNCIGNINVLDNIQLLDKNNDIIFFILKDFEKIDEYIKNIDKNKKNYIIFLNNEYLKLEKEIILTEKDFSENAICCELQDIFEDEKIEENKVVNISVSKIGTYYSCSLYYFFNCLLNLRKIRKFSFDSIEHGVLIHFFMEQYFKKQINDDEIYDFINQYLNKKIKYIYCPQRIDYISEKYSTFFKTITSKINNEFNKYKFVPKVLEKSFFKEIELENNIKINLIGRIDRIDENDNEEIIIIDYKTSNNKMNLKDLKKGVNVQSMIYLKFFSEKENKKIGFFNLICKDIDCFLTGISNKNIFNDDKINILSKEEFNRIINYSDTLIKNMAEKILNRDIYNNPTFYHGGIFRCEKCEYKKICKLQK